MWNYRDSKTSLKRSKDMITGLNVTAEGAVMCVALEGGVEKVKNSTGGASDVVIGFSELDNEVFTEDVKVEQHTVPAVSPYTVQLNHGALVGAGPYEIRVTKVVAGTDCVQNVAVGANQFYVTDVANGVVTFNVAQAGLLVEVIYRHTLTAVEATQLVPGVRPINNAAAAQLHSCTVLGGVGEVYTKEFDVTTDYRTGTLYTSGTVLGRLHMGSSGGGTDVSSLMRVIKVPTVADPFLGVAINTKL